MRITTSDLRDIARRGPGWRPAAPDAPIVTPAPIRKKAVRLYHTEGHPASLAYLAGRRKGSRGLAGDYGPGGRRAQQGARTRASFDRYVRLDIADGRPYADLELSKEIPIGDHVFAASLDVVLFVPRGFGGRLLNWDQTGLTDDTAEVVAAPMVRMIDQELGSDTCVEIEVWDLEHNLCWVVDRSTALAKLKDVEDLLDRTEAALP
jgi:hypothetical protein